MKPKRMQTHQARLNGGRVFSEWLESHEVIVVDDPALGRAGSQVALLGVDRDHVDDLGRQVEAVGQGHPAEGMVHQISLFALHRLAVDYGIREQLTHVDQDGSGDEGIHVDGQGIAEKLPHDAGAFPADVDHAPLVSHEAHGLLELQGKGIRWRSSARRALRPSAYSQTLAVFSRNSTFSIHSSSGQRARTVSFIEYPLFSRQRDEHLSPPAALLVALTTLHAFKGTGRFRTANALYKPMLISVTTVVVAPGCRRRSAPPYRL